MYAHKSHCFSLIPNIIFSFSLELKFYKMYIVKMFSTDFGCFSSKPKTRLRVQSRQARMLRWSTYNFLMFIYFHIWILRGCVVLSLDLHTMSTDQPWLSLQVSWSALTLWLSIYGILRGCVMHIYSQRSNHSLQTMEMHWIFHPHFQQKWVVREYNSCGLKYYFCSYKVNIS